MAVWIFQEEHTYTKPYVILFSSAVILTLNLYFYTLLFQFLVSVIKYKVCEKPILIYILFSSVYSFAKSFYFPEAIWTCALYFSPALFEFPEVTLRNKQCLISRDFHIVCIHFFLSLLFPLLRNCREIKG